MPGLTVDRALIGGFALGVATTWLYRQLWPGSARQEIIKGRDSPPVALVVIDMQKGFDNQAFWGGTRSNPGCEKRILTLIAKWREKSWPIIHVRHHSLETASLLNPKNGDGFDWKPGFAPQKGEIEIVKHVNSAFIGTQLHDILTKMGCPPLVLCGLTANHCVNTTARMAGNYGFQVFLPADATAVFPRNSFLGAALIPASDVHNIALSNLHREFCQVTNTANILTWVATDKWPTLVFQDAAEPPPTTDSPTEDVKESDKGLGGSLALFEHINLNIPDAQVAEEFYVKGLGFRLNPVSTNDRQVHVNMGVSQLHLPYKQSIVNREPVEIAQVWRGRVALVTEEDLAVVRDRALAHKASSATLTEASSTLHGSLRVVCPWGNSYVLTKCSASVKSSAMSFKGHPGGSSAIVGMPSATHVCPPGSAKKIATFYREILGCRPQVDTFFSFVINALQVIPIAGLTGQSSGLFACKIVFRLTNGAPTQFLMFEESDTAPPFDLYDNDVSAAYHVCVYYHTHEAFEASLRRAAVAGLLYVNPNFQGGRAPFHRIILTFWLLGPPEFASARTVEEGSSLYSGMGFKSCRCSAGQFRIKNLGGGLILEHEIRSPFHKSWPLASSS